MDFKDSFSSKPSPHQLLDSYKLNCDAAEDAALNFLCCDIGFENMPVLNVPSLRDLAKTDLLMFLKRGKELFEDETEKALFLVAFTDYISCAIRNEALFDVFSAKQDAKKRIPYLLSLIDRQWYLLFCNSIPRSDLSTGHISCLVDLLENAVKRLANEAYKECFTLSLYYGKQTLSRFKEFKPRIKAQRKHSHDHEPNALKAALLSKPVKCSKTSCSTGFETLNADMVVDQSTKLKSSNHTLCISTSEESAQSKNIQHKKKKINEITKYLSSKSPLTKKANTKNICDDKILETTSKENIPCQDIDIRAVTPPMSTTGDFLTEQSDKCKQTTPSDQPVITNLCSPPKVKTGLTKWLIPASLKTTTKQVNVTKKNAFAIMMKRSKENSKRKSLVFPS